MIVVHHRKAVATGLVAVASVAMMDVLAKAMGETYSAVQLTFFRFAFGLLPLLLVLPFYSRTTRPFSARPAAQFVRGGLMFGGALTFFFGLKFLPLAEATSILFAEPVIVIVIAAVFLRERLTRTAAASSILGLAGVIIMLRPGSAVLRLEALLPLCAATFSAIWLVLTKKLSTSDSASTSTFYATLSAALLSLLFMPFDWMLPPLKDLVLLAALGLIGYLSTYLYARACDGLQASTMALIDYSVLIWAVLFGFLVWHEIPDIFTCTGCLLIVGAGLLAVSRREPPPRPIEIDREASSAS